MLHNKAWSLLAMIWADRLGVCLGLLFGLWFLAATPDGRESLGWLLAEFAFVVWLLLRFLHFIVTGRLRPRGISVP